METLRPVATISCYAGSAIAGLVAWGMFIGALQDWLGWFLGLVLGIVLVPGVVIFPVIHWLVEDTWPVAYLWIMVAGGALIWIGGWLSD